MFYYGIIDTNGFLIYSIPVASLTEWTGKINATEFVDGISCLYSGYEEYPIDGREGPGMIVIDKDGAQIFNSLEIADENNITIWDMAMALFLLPNIMLTFMKTPVTYAKLI